MQFYLANWNNSNFPVSYVSSICTITLQKSKILLQLLTLALVIFQLSQNTFHFWPFEHLALLTFWLLLEIKKAQRLAEDLEKLFTSMCQAHPGTFTCLTSICFACFAGGGVGSLLLLWGRGEGCFCCWWEKESRGDLLPLSPSPYALYVILLSRYFFPILKILHTENLSAICELYSPSSIYESPFYHHTGRQPTVVQ